MRPKQDAGDDSELDEPECDGDQPVMEDDGHCERSCDDQPNPSGDQLDAKRLPTRAGAGKRGVPVRRNVGPQGEAWVTPMGPRQDRKARKKLSIQSQASC